jgi:hypothetical protein
MGTSYEPLHLNKFLSFVQQKITDMPTSFISIIILIYEAFKYGDSAKFWVYVGENAESLCFNSVILCNAYTLSHLARQVTQGKLTDCFFPYVLVLLLVFSFHGKHRHHLWPSQPAIQWGPTAFLWSETTGTQSYHPPPSSNAIKNMWRSVSSSSQCEA